MTTLYKRNAKGIPLFWSISKTNDTINSKKSNKINVNSNSQKYNLIANSSSQYSNLPNLKEIQKTQFH